MEIELISGCMYTHHGGWREIREHGKLSKCYLTVASEYIQFAGAYNSLCVPQLSPMLTTATTSSFGLVQSPSATRGKRLWNTWA